MTENTSIKRTKHNQTMPDLAEFYTTQEAADKLGFHVKSIPKMLRDKVLEGERFGRTWLVSKKSVQEYQSKFQVGKARDRRYKGKPKNKTSA